MRATSLHLLLVPLIVSLCLTGTASAKPPQKPSYSQFMPLIKYSPFTIKPTRPGSTQESPLEKDWTLASISPSVNGYSVTLMNKKNRKDRIRFLPGFSAGEFQLLDVKQDSRSSKNSKVRIRKGSQTAWITYDEKLIKARSSVASKKPVSNSKTSKRRSGPPIPGKPGVSRVRRVPKSGR